MSLDPRIGFSRGNLFEIRISLRDTLKIGSLHPALKSDAKRESLEFCGSPRHQEQSRSFSRVLRSDIPSVIDDTSRHKAVARPGSTARFYDTRVRDLRDAGACRALLVHKTFGRDDSSRPTVVRRRAAVERFLHFEHARIFARRARPLAPSKLVVVKRVSLRSNFNQSPR